MIKLEYVAINAPDVPEWMYIDPAEVRSIHPAGGQYRGTHSVINGEHIVKGTPDEIHALLS